MSQLTAYDKFLQQALKYGFSLFGLPPTGQTTVYQSGDDGSYKKGYPKIGVRFTDNGDGTITDNATGLMWVASPTAAAVGGTYLWAAAITACEGLTYATYSDWRLPNVKELQSIVDYGTSPPPIDTTFFTECQSSLYWSSTTFAPFSGFAWYVNFSNGYVSLDGRGRGYYVRPVRGGQ